LQTVHAQEESHRMTVVRKVYQRAIITPTHHIEQLWKDYENFENSVSRQLVIYCAWFHAWSDNTYLWFRSFSEGMHFDDNVFCRLKDWYRNINQNIIVRGQFTGNGRSISMKSIGICLLYHQLDPPRWISVPLQILFIIASSFC
jgi:hypothetical protein